MWKTSCGVVYGKNIGHHNVVFNSAAHMKPNLVVEIAQLSGLPSAIPSAGNQVRDGNPFSMRTKIMPQIHPSCAKQKRFKKSRSAKKIKQSTSRFPEPTFPVQENVDLHNVATKSTRETQFLRHTLPGVTQTKY